MIRKSYLVLILLLFAASCVFGQFAKVGSSGLQFLDIPVSTRAVGMGNTFTAVANDVSTLFLNPAGMENILTGGVYASYVQWPADIALNSMAAVYNVEGIAHFGLSFQMLDVGLMNTRTVYAPEGNGGTFGVEDWAIGFSASRSLTDRFALGMTFKWIHEKLADYEDNGWAVDLGGYYNTGFRDVTIGFSINNFGPEFQFVVDNDGDGRDDEDFLDSEDNDGDGLIDEDGEEEAVPLPIAFRFGVSMPVMQQGDNSLLLILEIEHPNDNKEHFNLGAEYWYGDMFALRGGYNMNMDAGSGLFAGAGFKLNVEGIGALQLDYAFADMGILDMVHRASFGFSF
jgi:hypothetical protein